MPLPVSNFIGVDLMPPLAGPMEYLAVFHFSKDRFIFKVRNKTGPVTPDICRTRLGAVEPLISFGLRDTAASLTDGALFYHFITLAYPLIQF